jgi:hypothetical protein
VIVVVVLVSFAIVTWASQIERERESAWKECVVDGHYVGNGNSCRRRSKIYLHLDYQPMSASRLRSHLNGPSSSRWTWGPAPSSPNSSW